MAKTKLKPPSPTRSLGERCVSATRERRSRGVLAIVVSNNPYELARWDRLGQRHRLDTGMLQISALDASMLDGLVERLRTGTPIGAMEIRPALRHWMSEHLEMGVLGQRVRAGIDGEPIILEAPLRFSVEPGAARAPAGGAARGPAGAATSGAD